MELTVNLTIEVDPSIITESLEEQAQEYLKEISKDPKKLQELIKKSVEESLHNHMLSFDVYDNDDHLQELDDAIKPLIKEWVNKNKAKCIKEISESVEDALRVSVDEIIRDK